VAAGKYYVMTANSDLYLAIPDWINHVSSPPEEPTESSGGSYITSEARLSAYHNKITKTGYPIIFQGAVGITDRQPDSGTKGNRPWPLWEGGNQDLTYFAGPDAGPTTVYDGAGDGTVIISGSELVAYNVTTAEEEWRHDHRIWDAKHEDMFYRPEAVLDLKTGESSNFYSGSSSHVYEAQRNGKEVIGFFDDFQFVTADGTYMAVKMKGQSRHGEYRVRGVRLINTETGEIAAQRTVSGNYQSDWRGDSYAVAAGGDYAAVVSAANRTPEPEDPTTGPAKIIDLKTNQTIANVPYRQGRDGELEVTENGVVLVPQLSCDRSVEGTDIAYGETEGNYSVYDPNQKEIVGQIPVALERGERISSVRVRDGTLYILSQLNDGLKIKQYDGLSESLSVTATTNENENSVTVTVSDLNREPVSDATVQFGEHQQTTNADGDAVFDVSLPSNSSVKSYPLQVRAGDRVHETTLNITYEQIELEKTDSSETQAVIDGTLTSIQKMGIVSMLAGFLMLIFYTYQYRLNN
jgi:hypothetical protein